MPRVILSRQRLTETKRANIGHIIIFCEGISEKNYFDYFAQILKDNKYNDIKVELETAGGNAQRVLNFANDFLSQEQNQHKFASYAKYLAFDCDAPPTIQAVILAASCYELLATNLLFETWLLMHFENVDIPLSKGETENHLSNHLDLTYKKGDIGIIRKIIQNGSPEEAIQNAKRLAAKYEQEDKNMFRCIDEMNPYTTVYELVEQFMLTIS